MSTHVPPLNLSRPELVMLATLVGQRHMEVLDAAHANYAAWVQLGAGSEEARTLLQCRSDNLRYAADLNKLWLTIDAAIDGVVEFDDVPY